MPMIPFLEKFPELGPAEARSAKVTGWPGLPDGEYGFFELYCNEPGCDCQRVLINVLRPKTGWGKVWATISYGWGSLEYYRKRIGPFAEAEEMLGPALDPFNPQSQYSSPLLELFKSILESPEYVDRLKRHYEMFRATVDKTGSGPRAPDESSRIQKQRMRLWDPKRRKASPH